jgi:hypothetical protein
MAADARLVGLAGHSRPPRAPWFLPLIGAYYRIKDRFQ